jgi:hypothetical protein
VRCQKIYIRGFNPISLEVVEKVVPVPGLGKEMGEMLAFMDEFGYEGGDPSIVYPEEVSYSRCFNLERANLFNTAWSSLSFDNVGGICQAARLAEHSQ